VVHRVHLGDGLVVAGDPTHLGDGADVEAHLYCEVPSLMVHAPWKIVVDAELLQSTIRGLTGAVDLRQAGDAEALGLSVGPHTRLLMPIKQVA
ncbi:MAG: hypothetical protein WKF86_07740, partial [Acidimicrobiales bacterium]